MTCHLKYPGGSDWPMEEPSDEDSLVSRGRGCKRGSGPSMEWITVWTQVTFLRENVQKHQMRWNFSQQEWSRSTRQPCVRAKDFILRYVESSAVAFISSHLMTSGLQDSCLLLQPVPPRCTGWHKNAKRVFTHLSELYLHMPEENVRSYYGDVKLWVLWKLLWTLWALN